MPELDPLLQSAIQLHGEGRRDEAAALYRQVVDAQGAVPAVLNLLGIALREMGRYAEAADVLRRAVDIDPSQVAFIANLGEAYRGLGQTAQAIDCYRQATQLAPALAELHNDLGALLAQVGRLDEAADCYTQALRCDPSYVDAHYNLGNLYSLRRQFGPATACYRQALALCPGYVEAQCNYGNALRELGDLVEARRWLESALALRADFVPALANLGLVLENLGLLAEARPYLARAVELAPDKAALHLNMGTLLKDLGDPAAALPWYDRAIALDGEMPQAWLSRGSALLALGDFEQGWAGYEHRVRCEGFDTPRFEQPRWDGSPLQDRTLLIHSEQGWGDTLQFIRYVRLANGRGGKVLVAVQPELVPLLGTSGVENLLPTGDPLPPFDVYAPLMSLPYLFGTRLPTIPADVPYLAVEPARVEKWRQHMQAYEGIKVGIVWQGRPVYRADRLRSIPLASFAPLAQVPGVRLFSLQKGPGSEQLAALAAQKGEPGYFDVVELGSLLDNDGPVFQDTAAVMKNLDLVVTADTGAAHLAGGLGLPIWVALCIGAEWRWLAGREDSPWYPTMRLFRQTVLGDWSDVFHRMADALAPTTGARRL